MFDFTRMTFRSPLAQPVHFTTKPNTYWMGASPVIEAGYLTWEASIPRQNKVPRDWLVNEGPRSAGLFVFETGCHHVATSLTRSPTLKFQQELWLSFLRAPVYATQTLILH